MDIIQLNPYRVLGVFANSSAKERMANFSRMKAFLKVRKQITFPLDVALPIPVIRTSQIVDKAEADLTLPKDQMRYAQFWFIKTSPLDEVAFNNLFAGNTDKAISIWEKRPNEVSSLQNRIVCSLIKEDYDSALSFAETLYADKTDDFVRIVLGDDSSFQSGDVSTTFIDTLCDEVGASVILPYIKNDSWRKHVGEKTISPIMEALQTALETAKQSRGKGSNARLAAGTKLMTTVRPLLIQLKKLLSISNLQYQMIADKVGLEILQCGIDYYNSSEESDAAHKAMKLQAFAQSVVVGQVAKDRCKENVDILKNIIANLPPQEVFAEDKAIHDELNKCCKLPDKICHAVTLLNNTKRYLQAMKRKLGGSNDYYLKISTQVIIVSLHKIVEEVNKAQEYDASLIRLGIDVTPDRIRQVLEKAWKATLIMDGFDMEEDYRKNYDKNRSILKNMCVQLGVPTNSPVHSKPQCEQNSFIWVTKSVDVNDKPTETPTKITPPDSTSSTNGCFYLGCLIPVVVIGLILYSLSKCGRTEPNTPIADDSDSVAVVDTTMADYDPSTYDSFNEVDVDTAASDDEDYLYNSLLTGDSPYTNDLTLKGKSSSINVSTDNSGNDLVVIIKHSGEMVRNAYIVSGESFTFRIPNGVYQVFFYSGRGWNPHKLMSNGKEGGFVEMENFTKDSPIELNYQGLQYSLKLQQNGNFDTQQSSESEAF